MKAEVATGWSRTIAATDAAMARVGLVDAPAHEGLTRLAQLAAESMGAPVALISVVQPALDRQFLAAAHGLGGPVAEARQTPLAYSFCKHVRKRGRPLVITDALKNALVRDNPAVVELGVSAYCGVPIRWPDGTVIGALCVVDGVPRGWTASDLERLGHLARCVDDQIRLLLADLARCVDDQIRLLLALHGQRAALTRAELAATARDLMFREINHELRTPLNFIMGFASILDDEVTGPLTSEQHGYMQRILSGSEVLLGLIEDLLDMSRIQAGKFSLSPAPIAPAEVIDDALAALTHLADQKGQTVTLIAE
ncbi:MAG: histidine kinase dimerization/phospho-acceptor domain-containing protein, partial [Thermaurantiacus sp.]